MKQEVFTKTYINEKLPFIELRYSNSNHHYKNHFHDTFSLGANKEGSSIYLNKDKRFLLEKDKLSIINPHDVHSCNSTSEVLNKYYMMYLDVKWCENIQKSINPNIESFSNISEEFLVSREYYERFINLCDFVFDENSIEEKENELLNFYFDFFSLFLEDTKDILVDDRFNEISTYIKKHYKENLTLDDLSNKFDINPFYLIRLFKTHLNMTPHTYILNVKVNEAKKLLKSGNSIVNTALECGFFDQSHFHRNFLKYVATTPNEYKINFVQ